ncbi:hypothetical protein EVAR_23207_1 [Eumeta japonica]|uniref:Uncharacterized protein n=1 Tax=Eumeta variegata TaxID=151549 RepID=A0A4C1VGQ6_EUMVA|nr:hypothetical protein EVAR_23207_1 [Eumeta japonica]
MSLAWYTRNTDAVWYFERGCTLRPMLPAALPHKLEASAVLVKLQSVHLMVGFQRETGGFSLMNGPGQIIVTGCGASSELKPREHGRFLNDFLLN